MRFFDHEIQYQYEDKCQYQDQPLNGHKTNAKQFKAARAQRIDKRERQGLGAPDVVNQVKHQQADSHG